METDDRAVFTHVSGGWIAPRRIVYAGSVSDLAVSLLSGAVAGSTLPKRFVFPITGMILLGGVYTALRRWITRNLPDEYETFSGYLQQRVPRFDTGVSR